MKPGCSDEQYRNHLRGVVVQRYLQSSKYIDWDDSRVSQKAKQLAASCSNKQEIAKACFEFVRDEIKHSGDYKLDPVTCKASDVLKYGTGYCYAKSHLLAALLRANGIPAGLCYQRLTKANDEPLFCLHGLNAIYLKEYGWYRVDPRGNKPGVDAQFCPPMEKLAFPIIAKGEADLPEIWPEPITLITDALERYKTQKELQNNFPDIELITTIL